MSNFKEDIVKFLEGKLDVNEELLLLRTIKESKEKRQIFIKEQQTLKSELIKNKDKNVDRQWQLLKSRLEYRPVQKERRIDGFNSFSKVIAIAAAFIIGVIISGVFFYTKDIRNTSQVSQEISIPYGGKTKFTLPDGSLVWLNSGSKLMFMQNFDNGRLVKLEGEGYFEVVKDKSTFIVETKYGNIEVLGTTFNLKAYADDDFQATLVEGKIKYNRKGLQPIILNPNQQLAINKNNQPSVNSVEVDLVTSWKDGKLIFKREPFEKVAKRLEKWFNVNIDINNTEMKNLWFTGTIEMETLSEVMDLVSKSLPVTYSYNSKTRKVQFDKK